MPVSRPPGRKPPRTLPPSRRSWTPIKPKPTRSTPRFRDEYGAYKDRAERALAAAVSVGDTGIQTARDEAALSLAALQTEFDAYQTEADAKYAALSDSFDAYKANAEATLAAAVSSGRGRRAGRQG